MTPTEIERLLTEAEKEVSLDVKIDYEVEDIWIKGYVAGATAEHDKARNQAIDDCKKAYENLRTKFECAGLKPTLTEVINHFESLKTII